jgi:hypothetical protein
MAGPPAWQRIEELVQRLLELYGAGLERVLRNAVEVEGTPGALVERLRADPLVSSLLVLHGLHPSSTAQRISASLDAARDRLGLERLELAAVDPSGHVRVRATPDPRSCPSSGAAAARAIERTVIEAAPEVASVVVEGLDTGPQSQAAGQRLVQLRRPGAGATR